MSFLAVPMLLASALVLSVASSSSDESAPGPTDALCAATAPNGMTPPGEEPGLSFHGNGLLYTALWPGGEILADAQYVDDGGRIVMKLPWWRAPGVGEPGDLEIVGQDISTGAPVESMIPAGYGQSFQATGVIFPGEGCFEVTGRSGQATLTFVTRVTIVEAPITGSS